MTASEMRKKSAKIRLILMLMRETGSVANPSSDKDAGDNT